MSIGTDDKLSNSDNDTQDNYYKVYIDASLLSDRLEIVKNKMRNTPWYCIWTHIGLQKELSCVQREADEVGKRLERLDEKYRNPVQIVKRV